MTTDYLAAISPAELQSVRAVTAWGRPKRLGDFLPYNLSVITNLVSAALFRTYHSRRGLSVTGWRILGVLAIHQPLSAKGLAERTAMSQMSISREVPKLVKLGMVSCRVDRRDKRQLTLRLNAKGSRTYNEIFPLAIALESELLKPFTRSEVATLRSLIDRLAAHATATLGEGPHGATPMARAPEQ